MRPPRVLFHYIEEVIVLEGMDYIIIANDFIIFIRLFRKPVRYIFIGNTRNVVREISFMTI